MFKIITIEEIVQVPARLFGKSRMDALEHQVNKKYANKVITDIGLCIALWDWVTVGEDRLVPQSGESCTQCVFRLVVFAPFEGEVIFSKVNSSNERGLYLGVSFFDTIHVPKRNLPKPSTWDTSENVWIWKPPRPDNNSNAKTSEKDSEESADAIYMDVTNESVVRVASILYDDRSSKPPDPSDCISAVPAMSITASLHDHAIEDNQGLGDPSWWYEETEEEFKEDKSMQLEEFNEKDMSKNSAERQPMET